MAEIVSSVKNLRLEDIDGINKIFNEIRQKMNSSSFPFRTKKTCRMKRTTYSGLVL